MSSTQTLTQRRVEQTTPSLASKPLVSQGGVVVRRVPSVKPPFSVGDIRARIPAHCFTKPLTKSFGYLFADLIIVATLYAATSYIPLLSNDLLGNVAGPIARHVLWIAYWLAQGAVMTGLWVIGHECGHRGFADSEFINDAVGLVVHSLLLVPYFSWQISHKRHHSNTGSVEHDEVFVPVHATPEERARQQRKQAGEHEDEGFVASTLSTLHRMAFIVIMLTAGWPAYLFANVTGNKSYRPDVWVNHFAPTSPIYTTGSPQDALHQKLILLSDVTLIAVFGLLYKCVQWTSLAHVVYTFFIPYLIVNFWLVLITYLQHTDLNLPHYTDGEWDWLRGALATVDRDYGIINVLLHHITDTHVVHHLFSTMPHYHAQEATEAVKPLLGDYYRFDNTPIGTALWNSFRDCTGLHPCPQQKGVHWFLPK